MRWFALLLAALIPLQAEATRRTFSGFEAGRAYKDSNGTTEVQSSIKKSGTYAFRSHPTTTAVGYTLVGWSNWQGDNGATLGEATVYFKTAFYAATLPSADSEEILGAWVCCFTFKGAVRITSAGNLAFYDKDNALVETGSTALATGTWYTIEAKFGTGASAAYEVRINGVSELSGTANQTTSNTDWIYLGKAQNNNGETVDFYYDDVATDNAAYPGETKVLGMTPTGQGSGYDWTAGTGGSDYQEVDETPNTDADYVQSTGTAGDEALFTLSDPGELTGATIKGVKVTGCMRENTSVTSANTLRIKSGSSTVDNLNTAMDHTTTVACHTLEAYVDPATAAAWTPAAVLAAQVGSVESNAVAMRMTLVHGEVEFVPATASGGGTGGILIGAW